MRDYIEKYNNPRNGLNIKKIEPTNKDQIKTKKMK